MATIASAVSSGINSDTSNSQASKTKAQQLIAGFQTGSTAASTHYPYITKARLVAQLSSTINNPGLIHQRSSSLCGPASFFYTIASTRADLYVQTAIDLYTNGQATIGSLKLQASSKAKNFNPTSANVRDLDWLMLTSVKDNYHDPSQQFAGITLPRDMKKWFTNAGFKQVHDDTTIFSHRSVRSLLNAQTDYSNNYTICMLMDLDVFRTPSRKKGRMGLPNHWVVLNSDIKIEEYDEATKNRKPPAVINTRLTKLIEKEISQAQDKAESEANTYETDPEDIESDDRIQLSVFTWGNPAYPPYGRVSMTQTAKLYYFLRHYYGYVKAKW